MDGIITGFAACLGRANHTIRPWLHMVIPMCGRASSHGSDGVLLEPFDHAADLRRIA